VRCPRAARLHRHDAYRCCPWLADGRALADLLSGVENPANVEYIEELIFRQEPFLRVMRLLCLYSMTTGGLKPKVLESFRREIIQVRMPPVSALREAI